MNPITGGYEARHALRRPNNQSVHMMKHLILSLLFALTAALAVSAQNRVVPELELPPIEHKAADDTLNFEERPYFLLIDQCEQALREQKYDDAALRLIEAMSVEPATR